MTNVAQVPRARVNKEDLFAYKVAQWSSFWRKHGYPDVPDLHGKRVLDMGCGRGAYCMAALQSGARVVGLDAWAQFKDLHRDLMARAPDDTLEFRYGLMETFTDSERFDIIITHETFEHVMDLPAALKHIADVLKPEGTVLASWGPIWSSPLGGHVLVHALQATKEHPWRPRICIDRRTDRTAYHVRIPWSHRLFTGAALRAWERQHPGHGASIQTVRMNGLTYRDYERIIAQSPLKVTRWRTNVGTNPAYRLLRLCARLPGGANLFTQNVYATLVHRG